MSERATTRFFDPKMALGGGGVFVAGMGLGAYCVLQVVNEHRISIGGFLFAGFLVLLGGGLFFSAFPKGCRACSKRFTEDGTTFPAQFYDQVVAIFQQGDPAALATLATVPLGSHHGWAGLEVNYCAGCRRLAEVSVSEQRSDGQHEKWVRGTGAMALGEPMLSATLEMIQRRPKPPGA